MTGRKALGYRRPHPSQARRAYLAAPPAAGGLPSLEQLIERVRIICTVYDPDTGEYRYDWSNLNVFENLSNNTYRKYNNVLGASVVLGF